MPILGVTTNWCPPHVNGGVSALMKLGLFSLRGTCSKEPVYEITAPEFDEITITLDPRYYSGKEFKIRTHNNTPKNMYIQKAQLNGKPLDNCWFYHKDFAKGGLLELWLGSKPNKQWGIIVQQDRKGKLMYPGHKFSTQEMATDLALYWKRVSAV